MRTEVVTKASVLTTFQLVEHGQRKPRSERLTYSLRARGERPVVNATPIRRALETTLIPPRARQGLIDRPGLLSKLDSFALRPLTLVSAPAGYGKTSLLANWSKRRPESVAWLTLEGRDDDPVRFLAHIAEAIEQVKSGVGFRAATILRTRGPDPELALHQLLEDLEGAAPLSIVLDDLHLVENPTCLGLLEYAVEHLPPRVHFVAGSRVDPLLPLGRFRARGLLGEVRARDLAFTAAEARELLVDVEGLDLSEEEVQRLLERTEGWPVALYLAAIWLREEDDPSACAAEFAVSQRYVAEYLTQEVLAKLDPDTRTFLIRASVFDRFSAPLCDEVLQRDDSRAVLTKTARSNLLLVPLDEAGEWFRFHHLLDELLALELRRSEPHLVDGLHRGAARWFEGHDLSQEAFEHALAAGDADHAATILSGVRLTLLRDGNAAELLRLTERLPPDVVLRHPELATGSALGTCQDRRPIRERMRWLEIAERSRTESPETWSLHAESTALIARALAIDGDIGTAAAHARRALMLPDEDVYREGEVLARATLAYTSYLLGETDEAWRQASKAVSSLEAPKRPHGVLRALGTLALLAADAGRTDEALAVARQAVDFATERHFTTAASGSSAQLALGRALAARGRMREAVAAVEHGERLSRAPDPSVQHAHALIVLADVRARSGSVRPAADALGDAELEIKTFTDPAQLPRLASRVKRRLRAANALVGGRTEPLSSAELAVLRLLATELSQRAIGHRLFLSVNTIKTHTRKIYRKLEVSSREDAVARANGLGLIGTADSPR